MKNQLEELAQKLSQLSKEDLERMGKIIDILSEDK